MTASNFADHLSQTSPPRGLVVFDVDDGSILIEHQRTQIGCLNHFVFMMLFMFLVAGAAMLHGRDKIVRHSTQWLAASPFLAVIVLLICWIYLTYCRTSFQLCDSKLIMTVSVLGIYRRQLTIPKAAIKRVVQISDGGGGDDSFPSWGLVVYTDRKLIDGHEAPTSTWKVWLHLDKKVTLVFRQPYDVSQWLGQTLSLWSNTPFTVASRDTG